MPLPTSLSVLGTTITITIPLAAGDVLIFVGANGSGKTRLATKFEEQLGTAGMGRRVAAHRALSMDLSVAKTTEADARSILDFGMPASTFRNVGAIFAHREGHRWGGRAATALLNDFDAVLQLLFANHANGAAAAYDAAFEGRLEGPPLPTMLTKLRVIWSRIFPEKPLKITADSIMVQPISGQLAYSASEMSDGERAVFYMLGQVLSVDAGDVLIFDEPELHVHRAILGRLWDEAQGIRPDCAFILITHDLEFAASRPGMKFVLRGYTPPGNFTVEPVPQDTGFDEEIATLILGSRTPVLFVEGDGNSLDLAIYRACYPKMTVLARGSCEAVIHSVRSMKANNALTRVTCAGLVDADSRDDSDIARLATLGISVLPVAEIENLLALPSVANAILQYDSYDTAEKEQKLATLKTRLFEDAAKSDVQTTIVLEHTRRRIDRALNLISFEPITSEDALAKQLLLRVGAINVDALASEIRAALSSARTDDDLPALLKIYDQKDKVLAITASVLKNTHKDVFVNWVSRVMKDPDKPSLREAVAAMLPELRPI